MVFLSQIKPKRCIKNIYSYKLNLESQESP